MTTAPHVAGPAERFDPKTADEETRRAVHQLTSLISREEWPEDAVQPYELTVANWDQPPPWTDHRRWIVREGRDVVALGALYLEYTETNRELARFVIDVHPSARRKGLGTLIAGKIADDAAADGRVKLASHTVEGSIGEDFLASIGMARKLTERRSSVPTAKIDKALLESWVERAEERAHGYSLVGFDDRCPDEMVDAWIDLVHVMNTAPRDDLDMEDEVVTVERFRHWEAKGLDRGYRGWALAARDADGALVGFTELGFAPYEPTIAWQGGTAVRPEHRNVGLGRWLKAAMALRLLAERPDVVRIDTSNAYSNDPMLAINIAMGFEFVRGVSVWQCDTAALGEACRQRHERQALEPRSPARR